jgi:hypothetical protein
VAFHASKRALIESDVEVVLGIFKQVNFSAFDAKA